MNTEEILRSYARILKAQGVTGIQAIKQVRDAYPGTGLKEAKEAVDAVQDPADQARQNALREAAIAALITYDYVVSIDKQPPETIRAEGYEIDHSGNLHLTIFKRDAYPSPATTRVASFATGHWKSIIKKED